MRKQVVHVAHPTIVELNMIISQQADQRSQGSKTMQFCAGRVLLATIGGDTLVALHALASGRERLQYRPMALQLLWAILERGQAISRREWKIVRVAIVDIRDETYM